MTLDDEFRGGIWWVKADGGREKPMGNHQSAQMPIECFLWRDGLPMIVRFNGVIYAYRGPEKELETGAHPALTINGCAYFEEEIHV